MLVGTKSLMIYKLDQRAIPSKSLTDIHKLGKKSEARARIYYVLDICIRAFSAERREKTERVAI